MKRILAILVAVALSGLLLSLTGCGDGSSSSSTPLTPGVPMVVGAEIVPAAGMTKSATRAANYVTWAPGATVTAINFRTGETIATAVIGPSGTAEILVPAGQTVAFIITGTVNGKSYRMSILVPNVPSEPQVLTATPATTLATEALAQQHFRKAIDQDTFDNVLAAAETYLADHPDADISLDGGLLNPSAKFGSSNALTNEVAAVVDAVPAVINSNVSLAKNAVDQIKAIGTPMQAVATDEIPSLRDTAHTALDAMRLMDFEEVAEVFIGSIDRLSVLMVPAVEGDWEDASDRTIFGLTMGKAYIVEDSYDGLVLTEALTGAVANQITITYDYLPDEAMTLVAKQVGTNWEVTQTSSYDDNLEYKFVRPITLPDANPNVSGMLSLTDEEFVTPVEITGSIVAIGTDQEHYTRITLDGELASDVFGIAGTFIANFPAAKPVGASASESIYAYPTSFSITDGVITHTLGDYLASSLEVASLTGKFITVTEEDGPSAMPTEIVITDGEFSASITGAVPGINPVTYLPGSAISVTGDMSMKCQYTVYQGEAEVQPLEFKITDGAFKMTAPQSQSTTPIVVNCAGSMIATAKAVTSNGAPDTVPTYLKIDGTYSNSDTKVALDGLLEARWQNAAADMGLNEATGTITLQADLTRGSYRPYNMDLAITLNAGNMTCLVKKMAWGGFSLTGSMTAVIDAEEDFQNVNLSLESNNGVKFTFTDGTAGVAGNIKIGSEQVATIGEQGDLLRVTYTDSTYDSIPL